MCRGAQYFIFCRIPSISDNFEFDWTGMQVAWVMASCVS